MWVKICGITRPEDAEHAIAAGADAIGLNFVASSPRAVDRVSARAIAELARGRIELVGVIAELQLDEARALRAELELDCLQLHGSETPAFLAALLPRAFKAVRIGGPEDVAAAEAFAGERLLVDAKVEGQLGGTGARVDPELVRGLAERRRLVLAGGLRPENVATLVGAVRPWGVDVASGVEQAGEPRKKSAERVQAFVRAARGPSLI